jgi:hypothetical protein
LDAKVDGHFGEEYMKMQDDQIKELFQQKLSGHESPVDPALWNSIQSGIAAQTGTVVSAVAKTSMIKIASIVTGIVLTGAITGYYLLSKPNHSETVASSNTQVAEAQIHPVKPEQTPISELTQDNSSEIQSITPIKKEQDRTVTTIPTPSPFTSIRDEKANVPQTPGEIIDNRADNPFIQKEQHKQATPQESKDEHFTTDFNVVGPANMGLNKMLIPAYTKAHQYKWTINHGEAVYNELSTTHEFLNSGEHHIRLDIEKTPGSGFTEYSEKTICVCASAEVNIDYDLFTPNGDNYSKVFDPSLSSRNIIPIRLLIIEKSSGKQVFEGTNENAKWDGTGAFGQEYPSGQYFYQFSATDLCGKNPVDKTGFIRLER